MSKLTISDAAQFLGVSKEAIHNRIRRGTLHCIVENDVKLVVINEDDSSASVVKKSFAQKQTPMHGDEKYYKFLEEQNTKLQHRVDTLEGETRTLRDQKEQMLIDERIKIENIYKEKDEQLKNIINAISSKLMLATPQEVQETIEGEIDEDTDEDEQDMDADKSRLISLNKYLKGQDFSKKKIAKIKEKFKERAKDDSRVVTIGKKYYIDLHKYDYSDFSI